MLINQPLHLNFFRPPTAQTNLSLWNWFSILLVSLLWRKMYHHCHTRPRHSAGTLNAQHNRIPTTVQHTDKPSHLLSHTQCPLYWRMPLPLVTRLTWRSEVTWELSPPQTCCPEAEEYHVICSDFSHLILWLYNLQTTRFYVELYIGKC